MRHHFILNVGEINESEDFNWDDSGHCISRGHIRRASSSQRSLASKDSEETNVPVNQLLQEAAKYEAQGNKLKAKGVYDQIISNYPDYDRFKMCKTSWEN